MKITGASITHRKMRGEWAELRFMARASEHGISISKPWGDSCRYDFIAEFAGKFLRVQVKSTTYRRGRCYVCNLHGGNEPRYSAEQIDFVAAYIIPKNIWFVFPIHIAAKAKRSLVLSPHLKVSKYGIYQEAWHLMRGEPNPECSLPSPSTI